MSDTSPRSENVKVVVRVRPLSATEKSAGYQTVVKVDSVNNSVILTAPPGNSNGAVNNFNDIDRVFAFDSVFSTDASQVLLLFKHCFIFNRPTLFYCRWKSTTKQHGQ